MVNFLQPLALLHISISLIAFLVLGLAAIYALLLGLLHYGLRHKPEAALLKSFPPLQTLEKQLLRLIWVGFILLSGAILSGFIYFQPISQTAYLFKKSALSIIAWALFGSFLYGHYRFGWRGITTARWTLVGVVLLILAYLGSKNISSLYF